MDLVWKEGSWATTTGKRGARHLAESQSLDGCPGIQMTRPLVSSPSGGRAWRRGGAALVLATHFGHHLTRPRLRQNAQ